MADFDVDLFVIGAGSGGVRAARIAAGYGARVMIAEEYRVGGACVIRGCVPKKLLVQAGRFAREVEDAAGFGWSIPQATFDWTALIAAKNREITRLEGVYTANLKQAGVEIFQDRAVLEDAHTVLLAHTGRRLRARTILISTGSRPSFNSPIPGGEHGMTSNEAFDLERFPKRVLVVGGGYIAVEFAGLFRNLGAEVSIAYRGERLLGGFDDDIRAALEVSYQRDGITLLARRTLERIDKTEAGYRIALSDKGLVEADFVLVATGRTPATASLGLEAAGVLLDDKGAIKVDAVSRTSVPSIYAVGDVTNRVNLTPAAIREGHAFADTVFGGKPTPVVHALVPSAVFSTPEIGTVGLSETQARRAGHTVVVYKTNFRPMKATMSGREERVLMKLVVDRPTDTLLGVHILGEAAGEMIQLAGVALTMGATKADFDRTLAVHPTAAEELVTMRVAAQNSP